MLPPSDGETEDLNEQLVKTVIDGAHLFPLPPVEVKPPFAPAGGG